eukprot:scaffold115241_cov17-Prasinocladus_malaysianus.AAC.1
MTECENVSGVGFLVFCHKGMLQENISGIGTSADDDCWQWQPDGRLEFSHNRRQVLCCDCCGESHRSMT